MKTFETKNRTTTDKPTFKDPTAMGPDLGRRPDGSSKSAKANAQEQLQRNGEDRGSPVRDTTGDLARLTADLLRVREEGKELRGQLRQSQKMESIGALAGGLAHDFNNFLSIIQGYASVIVERPAEPEKVVKVGQAIVRAVEQGAALVRQLLAVARPSEPKLEPTEVNGLLQRLTSLLIGTFPKTVTIALDLDAKMPNIMADANQINQALLNLCINARDAMPDGGNLILRTRTISGAELRARFNDVKAERYVSISVADTGSGMEEETRSRIFEPFFTTKGAGKGTG
ncbi:MAG TPA: ATP-binding protein, partial [Candidatus Binatia bacterium]